MLAGLNGRRAPRRLVAAIGLSVGLVGCRDGAEPAAPAGSQTPCLVASRAFESPRASIRFDRAPGFARVNVVVTSLDDAEGEDRLVQSYDFLCSAKGDCRISVGLAARAEASRGGKGRVDIMAESAGEVSTTFVEPSIGSAGVEPSADFAWSVNEGAAIDPDREVDLGAWTVRWPGGGSKLAWRVLFSSRPAGPRLKVQGAAPR